LPAPPKGKVYQVWCLKMSPLTSTSAGTIDTFMADTNTIFTIENMNKSETFGITLEDEGGSKLPNL
jgi:anti-sigma-K factor RskA